MIAQQSAEPDTRLAPFVRLYVQREARGTGAAAEEPVVARLGAILEFQFRTPYEIPIYGTDAYERCARITVVGPITYRRIGLVMRGELQSLAVLFRPFGFHALFGLPMAALAERGVEGHAVLGATVSALQERLGNCDSFVDRVGMLDGFLLERLARMTRLTSVTASNGYAGALGGLMAGGLVSVEEATRKYGLSARQLERKSLEWLGVAPKTLARVARFQRAMHLKARGLNWTTVAHAARYHDQAHMIRDFRVFTGGTPKEAMATIRPEHLNSLIWRPRERTVGH